MPTLRKDEPVWVPNGGLGDLVYFARWLRPDDAVLLDVNEVQKARVEWLLRALKIEVPVVFRDQVQAQGLWCEQWEYLSQRGGNPMGPYLKRTPWANSGRRVVAVHGRGSRRHVGDVWRSCWRLPQIVAEICPDVEVVEIGGAEDGPLLEMVERIASADFFVGVDSGPAHVAGAMGVPSAVILGASPDPRYVGCSYGGVYDGQKTAKVGPWPDGWETAANWVLKGLGL